MRYEEDELPKEVKSKVIIAEMCECGRLYKDRRDEHGKTMCSACFSGLSVEELKLLWGMPITTFIMED